MIGENFTRLSSHLLKKGVEIKGGSSLNYRNPGQLFVQQFGGVKDGDDIFRYVNFLREEAGLGVEPPINLARIYSHFHMPTPERKPLPDLQGLLVNPDRGIVLINENDPETRQRFTEGHELIEYLFSALPSGKGWAARQTGPFKLTVKERLCNEGAAELLMPRVSFEPRVREYGVSFTTGRELASEFQVSTTAALVQIVRVGPGRHAVVLWRMKNKPTEIRAKVDPNQLTLFGQSVEMQYPKKLRVEWALNGPGVPYVPPDKSIPEDASSYSAWRDGEFIVDEDNLNLGGIQGLFKCENQPFEVNEERFVISLVHFPSDSCPIMR